MNKVELVNNKLVVTLQDEDFPYICRICLGWRHLQAFREQPHLLDIFENMTNIEVTSDPNLPQNICVQCVNKLEDISKFIITSKKNETMLQEMLADKAAKNLLELTNSQPGKTNVPENVCSVSSSVPLIDQDEPPHQYVDTTSDILPPYLEVSCRVINENQLNTNLCQDMFKMENDFEIEAVEISPESIGNDFIKTEDFEIESNASSDSSWRPDSSLCDNFEDAQVDENVSKSSTCNNSIEIEAEKCNIKKTEECINDSPNPIDLKDLVNVKRKEFLEKKRQAERLRRQRLKNDPVQCALLKEKERKKYLRHKEIGVIKPINQMTPREQALQRQKWKEQSQNYRLRRALKKYHIIP